MTRIAVVLLLLALLVGAGSARADPDFFVHRAPPAADLAVPFWCEWGYDWDETCYRDTSDRVPIGGDVDKLWRAALRFRFDAIPSGSVVTNATLLLSFDGVCLGPRKTQRPCAARWYTIDVHPLVTADWFGDREVEFGPLLTRGAFWSGTPQLLGFDVTDQVIEWIEYGAPNHGLLLKLADDEEAFSAGGPKLPSSEFGTARLRPVLEVSYYRR